MGDQKQINFRADPELHEWLEAESKASGRSINWLIVHSLEMWRKRLERQRANSRKSSR